LLQNNYITASCSISNGIVHKDEKIIFEKPGLGWEDFLPATYQHLQIKYPRFYKMDGLCKLGWLATEILLAGNFNANAYEPESIGVVLANSASSLDTDIKYFATIKNIASPALFVYTLPNIVIGEICIRNQFKGENAFFISDEFDREFMLEYVTNLINNNTLQACICGWVNLLNEEYQAVLFLVEKRNFPGAIPLTEENINKLYR
jgi:hypothetical protein